MDLLSSTTLIKQQSHVDAWEIKIIDPADPISVLDEALSEAFTRWRPAYHCIAPKGWMNDPCAPCYDPFTKTYRLSFQWNPTGNTWGNISWGQASSKDLSFWSVCDEPSITPSKSYDHCAVYTGCAYSTGKKADGKQSIAQLYTSVTSLPIHHTLPYSYGCESLSLASSNDHGATWQKHEKNPILEGPPTDVTVTGWRDPFLAQWSSMAKLLGRNQNESLFGIVCGGIKDVTPTVFLYEVKASDLTDWTYLCPLINIGINKYPSRWSGDFGVNWEVVNFMTLNSNLWTCAQDFLICGSDGAIPRPRSGTSSIDQHNTLTRRHNLQLWMAGEMGTIHHHEGLLPEMRYTYGGFLDHGCFYAANSFWDPTVQRQVVFGWVLEEDLSEKRRMEQGWQGLLSLPRVLDLQVTPFVVRARKSQLQDITSFQCVEDAEGTFSVATMGIAPHPHLESLRLKSNHRNLQHVGLRAQNGSRHRGVDDFLDIHSAWWEIDCKLSLGRNCAEAGLVITHSSVDRRPCQTVIYFDAQEEAVFIRRPSPLGDTEINIASEYAPHTLFTTVDPATRALKEEELEIRAFWDKSVLEVFVNGRTAITTRIYTPDGFCEKIGFFAESAGFHDGSGADSDHVGWVKNADMWAGVASK